jgi:hypothetical protein
MSNNTPDKWVILKITLKDSTEPIYKVFATWYGGYLGADSWRMNSGIVHVEESDNYYAFHGHSGSIYTCNKSPNCYGTSGYSSGILNNMITKVNESDAGTVEVLDGDTNWMELFGGKDGN